MAQPSAAALLPAERRVRRLAGGDLRDPHARAVPAAASAGAARGLDAGRHAAARGPRDGRVRPHPGAVADPVRRLVGPLRPQAADHVGLAPAMSPVPPSARSRKRCWRCSLARVVQGSARSRPPSWRCSRTSRARESARARCSRSASASASPSWSRWSPGPARGGDRRVRHLPPDRRSRPRRLALVVFVLPDEPPRAAGGPARGFAGVLTRTLLPLYFGIFLLHLTLTATFIGCRRCCATCSAWRPRGTGSSTSGSSRLRSR